jgi:hypothetical protein
MNKLLHSKTGKLLSSVLKKKFNTKKFCEELVNFEKEIKNYWNIVDLAIIKALNLKDNKKIPKRYKSIHYRNKVDFFKTLSPTSFVYENLLSIRDGSGYGKNVNYLNCGLLTFGYSTGIKDDFKILFVEEDFLSHTGTVENEIFVPILIINNSENLKDISKKVVEYYINYNRFGVKLPPPDYGDMDHWFKDDIFSDMDVFINEDKQRYIDIKIMEKIFKRGFSMKIKNSSMRSFRNYFDPKYKSVPNGAFDIYFHFVNFKTFPNIGKHCNLLNANKKVSFKVTE